VQLVPYNPNAFDESILWTESKDLGDTFRCIRMVNNIRLNMDAFNGDKNHEGVRDGIVVVLWEWKKGDTQRWKIVPYYEKGIANAQKSLGLGQEESVQCLLRLLFVYLFSLAFGVPETYVLCYHLC
ncbi:hypothetical protein IFM89_018793, partial [Coptis chinensis]